MDRIAVRVKSIESFLKKATQKVDGRPKYSDPLNEIQDVLGARIVVFYTHDVDRICSDVKREFAFIESNRFVPDEPASFGYEGQHHICLVPEDIYETDEELESGPPWFELQIKTLFQHAWAQANHDIVYKTGVAVSEDKIRLNAFAAAQAWGADRVFAELANRLGEQS